MKSGVLFGALALVAACSSFSADGADDTGPTGADGGLLPDGAPAPVTGTFTGEVELTATVSPVTRNRVAKVAFSLRRGTNYSAPVIVRFEGLPPTITAEPLLVEGATSTGELLLDVGKDTPIGPLRGAKLVAVGQTDDRPTHSVSFETDVRGAPGDLDLTFGTAGILTVGDSVRGSEFDVDAQGRIVVLNDTSIRRFDADGQAAESTFTKTLRTGRALLVTHRGTDIFFGRNKPVSDADGTPGTESGGKLFKMNPDGSYQTTYGTNGSTTAGTDQTVFQIDTDRRAISFTGPFSSTASQFNYVPAGTFSYLETSKATNTGFVRGVVYFSDHSLAVAGEHTVAKLLADGVTLDTKFGTNGFQTFRADLHINDLVADTANRLIVTGHLDGGETYVHRLTAAGGVDASFNAVTTPFKVVTESLTFDYPGLPGSFVKPFAGRLAILSGKILLATQVEQSGPKCVVSRYLDDGKPDLDFGTDGRVTFTGASCYAHRIVRQRDGFVLVGGPVIFRFWE